MTSAYDQGRVPDFEMRHRLQLARESAGLRRDELAARMEVSRNSIINAETGRTTPRKLMLNAWALACGVPVSWIITGEPPANNPDGGGAILRTSDYQTGMRRRNQQTPTNGSLKKLPKTQKYTTGFDLIKPTGHANRSGDSKVA